MKLTTKLLIAFLIWNFLAAAVDAYLDARHIAAPMGWFVGSVLVSVALTFAWYYTDSKARGYRRPRWLSPLVVAFALAGVPLYLLMSRPRGMRLKAILRFSGCAALTLAAALTGMLVGSAAA